VTHWSPEDRDAIRAMLRRAAVVASDDSGSAQKLRLSGLASEQLDGVVRIVDFGFASNPPAGGEGMLLCPGGRSDRAMFIGGEHRQYRPTALPIGACALYNSSGQIIKLIQNEIDVVCGTLKITGDVHVTGAVIAGYGGADQVGLQTHEHAANNTPPTAGT
jgi:phage gp45-like